MYMYYGAGIVSPAPKQTLFVSLASASSSLREEQERQLTTGKRVERTELDFRCPVYRFAIGQASCLICARRRQLTFPFCC